MADEEIATPVLQVQREEIGRSGDEDTAIVGHGVDDQANMFVLQGSFGGYRLAQPALQIAPLPSPAFSACRGVI